ncbi:MAG: ABC transporter permease [Gammaproteobacteria bacterium]|nr:ABC transporter permease [Gammaproteobacteria bacterium]MCW9059073.1 ABC transporter permease [Gammaproteobacteria bacterium]
MTRDDASAEVDPDRGSIRCAGRWTVDGIGNLAARLPRLVMPAGRPVRLEAGAIAALDTSGAWLLQRLRLQLETAGNPVEVQGLQDNHADLYQRICELGTTELPREPRLGPLAGTGRGTLRGLEELYAFLSFFGAVVTRCAWLLWHPGRMRWKAMFIDLHGSGVTALGIVGLLSFLMGVVIAYQGAVQLRAFGADIYIADLVGLSMARELGPLLAAIIVAGRTGSAYAAQIGTMRVTDEVAALRTIGIEPLDMLVIPKVVALCLALPLLAVFADIMGVLGGMILAKLQLGLSFAPFLDRLQEAVSLRSFLIGLGKAPVFALVIALIGCFQGFRVRGSAASVGQHTTRAVVQAIFLIIVIDAQFSVIFSWLGI